MFVFAKMAFFSSTVNVYPVVKDAKSVRTLIPVINVQMVQLIRAMECVNAQKVNSSNILITFFAVQSVLITVKTVLKGMISVRSAKMVM